MSNRVPVASLFRSLFFFGYLKCEGLPVKAAPKGTSDVVSVANWRTKPNMRKLSHSKKTSQSKTPSCLVSVRRLPLERFKLSTDGRKWRACARTRRALLIELATYANPDGTFTRDERNYSPRAKTIEKTWCRSTAYQREDDLRDLGLLSWTRPNHYHPRIYQIHLDHLPDLQKPTADCESQTGPVFAQSNSSRT